MVEEHENQGIYAIPHTICRLQGLVHTLKAELDDLRSQFTATVERARVEGGDEAAVEIGE